METEHRGVQPPWERGLPWRQLYACCELLALLLRRDSLGRGRGSSGHHPPQGAASQAPVSPPWGPSALGPSRECAFSQQLFGLESGAQAALTSPAPGRGIQSPHEGECSGSNTWHGSVQKMSFVTVSSGRPCQAHYRCH